MTVVDRSTSCILGWAVDQERSEETLQKMVDHAPQAAFYFSDLFATDKSETYRVEGDNAELRHYLARLARKSRCFSRCVRALRNAIKLFVYAWNRRQLYKARYPDYPAYVMEFV